MQIIRFINIRGWPAGMAGQDDPSADELSDRVIDRIASKVAIATTTFYNPDSESDAVRADIAKNFVMRASEIGYSIVVVDGGSSDELLREFEGYGAKVSPEEQRGMGKGRRQAIRQAYDSGRPVIAWTEPEKLGYIPKIWKTAYPLMTGSADIVVPRRKSMKSYPAAQQLAEPLGNLFWKHLTGQDLDVWFGPRTWKREISDYFLDYDGEKEGNDDKWDSIFIPVMDAIIDGRRVISVDVDYVHPYEQSRIEENDPVFDRKRGEQLYNLMNSLSIHWEKKHGRI